MLRTVADENIPGSEAAVGALGPVTRLPGRAITTEALREADALLARSVTPVDGALLDGTPVRFVGTATAGTDHVDLGDLADRGVAFASAPGSNAASVADYVVAALLALAADLGESLEGRTLGVVGVGEVGGRVVPRARALGLAVLACDPPRAAAGHTDHAYLPLADVLRQSDVVTLHTPLTDAGPWPTRGLISDAAALRPDAWLVNAARGGVVTADVARALAESRPVVLDVWPGEPAPDPALVAAVALGTPHVAGYASDAKLRGTAMVAEALRRWAEADGLAVPPWDPATLDAPGPAPLVAPDLPASTPAERARWLDALARQAYDVRADDARFRAALADAPDRASAFAELRRAYPQRRELSRYSAVGPVPDSLRAAVTDGLGLSL